MPTFLIRPRMSILFAAAALIIASASLWAIFASAEVGPEITVTIHDSAHAPLLQAPLGTSIHANASVASSTASTTIPTGTVDFNLYPNMSCSGSPTTEAGVALVAGVAESATTSVGASGLSYRVRYNGDSINVPSESSCAPLTATAPSVSIATNLSTSTVHAGAFVFDTATLNNETANASGTVSYAVYTNGACTLGAQSAGIKTVTNGSVPNSDSIQFNLVGEYYWQAHYSGDQFNSGATSTCSSEKLTVLATSTATTTPNDDDNDNDNDKDNGKHKGFVQGLPFGIFKKMDDEYRVPPGILKRFGESVKRFWDSHSEDDDGQKVEKSKNKSGNSKGRNGDRED
ncbi:MAG: hypothetical protein AAB449_02095 [Patescibacteria group bacterium]